MYFSNITNQELAYFHGIQIPNFTITLTDALTSQLFKVETVISDSIYKIFPLFYTGEITSNNPNDRVLENKCVICQRTDKETYLTFISDENDEIRDYENFTTYYDIGDTLTTAQFNSVVSLLRQNTVNNDSIRIGSDYTGEYGEYEFDIEGTTIVDTGIVITDETLENGIKVRLVNPVFHYSTYTLQLQVLHYTDVNVMDDDNEDFKVIEALNVELTGNEWVDVDLSELEEGYIILLDSNVSITHDKTEIHGLFGLDVNVDPTIIENTDTAEITSTLLDHDGTKLEIGTLSGKTVYFFEKLEPTLNITAIPSLIELNETATIQSKVTDEDGSLPKGLKVYFYEAIEEHGDPEVTSISLSNTNDVLSYYNSDSTVLTATVLDQYGDPMENEEVTFTVGSTEQDTITTDENGEATYTYTSAGVGDVTITAECSLLQETYVIEDCIIANVNYQYTGTSSSDTVYSIGYDQIADLSNIDFEMTWTYRQTKYGCDVCLGASTEFSTSPIKSNYRVFVGNTGAGKTRHGYRTTSTTNTDGATSGAVSQNTDHTMKISKSGSTFTFYFNDNLLGTKTVSFWGNYNMFGVHTVQWNTGTTTISNLKIKAL